MPVVTNFYSFSFNSQTFGGAGSPYQILSVDGLEGIPAIRNQDDNRGYADGMFTGADFYSGRTITMIIQTFASGGNSAQTNFNTLQSKLLPQSTGTTPMYFLLSPTGVEQFINARVRNFKTTIDPNYTFGMITSQVEFFCPNPLYFNNTLRTATLDVSNPLGRTYDRVYPLTYGGGTYATTTSVTNDGWATAYPTITLTGPMTNPTFGNTTQGNFLSFSYPFSNTDTLVIDLYNKLITLNGVSARNLLSSGTWFSAPPGTSQFYMTGTYSVVGVTTATVAWYDTFI